MFKFDFKAPSDTSSSANNSLFSKNISEQNQSSLFGTSKNKSSNETSSLFGNNFQTQTNNNSLFQNQPKENDNNKKNENSTLFSFNLGNQNNNSILFGPKNNNKNEQDANTNKPFSLFGVNNKEENKENKNEFIINQNKEEKKESKKGGLFDGLLNKENEKPPSMFSFGFGSSNQEKKSLFDFDSNKKEKEIKSKLFNNNNDNDNDNNINKEEKKVEIKVVQKEDIKEEIIKRKKESQIDDKNKEIKKGLFYQSPKKEPVKEFEISTNSNLLGKKEKIDNNDNNDINTNTNTNFNINKSNNNNISDFKRIDDNEEIQNALKNLYISDILLPTKGFNNKSFNNNENNEYNKNIKNKIKKSKPIYFKLIIEIEGIQNTNSEGIDITCNSNETMSYLMRQLKILIKKKYKMFKEINDFEINLFKNGKKLPVNERESTGEYIKNKDKIIMSMIHLHSEANEEIEENEEDESKEEKNEDKILCPKDKLPILKRPGYYMNPNEYLISRMTVDEIKNVKNFAIYNENGKIQFDNPVSIYGANFDKLFNIKHDLIEYEYGEWCHSPRGKNFNVPATITLYNIRPNINLSNMDAKRKYLEFLKEKCKNNLNGTFLSYDFETYEIKYKIPYFY